MLNHFILYKVYNLLHMHYTYYNMHYICRTTQLESQQLLQQQQTYITTSNLMQ